MALLTTRRSRCPAGSSRASSAEGAGDVSEVVSAGFSICRPVVGFDQGLAARVGVKWSLASKWAPMAVEALDLNEKTRAACGGAGVCRSSATASRRGCRGSSRPFVRRRPAARACVLIVFNFVVSTCRAGDGLGWRQKLGQKDRGHSSRPRPRRRAAYWSDAVVARRGRPMDLFYGPSAARPALATARAAPAAAATARARGQVDGARRPRGLAPRRPGTASRRSAAARRRSPSGAS